MKTIIIGDRKIGKDYPPFIVAEMSGNHNQSLSHALKLVDAAAAAGVHALKIQTYTPDTMTIDSGRKEFFIRDPKNPWAGDSLYNLYKKAYTPWKWHKKIFSRCKKLGLTAFSTPFDLTAVDYLESLGVPCYKIASFENIDIPLIKKAASKHKPLIISTGLASKKDISEAIAAAKSAGCKDIVLLKCTSAYPAEAKDANLLTIPFMSRNFDCLAGLSDHSEGIGAALASISLGSCLIEKHFTLSRNDGGVDSSFSLEPHEMKMLVKESKRAWESLGRVSFKLSEQEERSKLYRRSLYAVKDIGAGERFTAENVRSIRPALGLPPKNYDKIIGKTARKNISMGTPLRRDLILNKKRPIIK
ncbi:MAG: pseudaminic acid synthase [Candidatus Omnitrophica bacterium]|nr:pseudaminic acid synthase [Candidatus Omnitrophota bacterium]